MIISQIIGGLGNQMFQYAAARVLSLQKNQPLLLDVSAFAAYPLHQGFELEQRFSCPSNFATENDIRSVLGWQSSERVRRIISNPCMTPLKKKAFLLEPHFHYWSGIKDSPDHCYLSGYWQSERYFSDYAAQIRADFSFKLSLNVQNTAVAEQIQRSNAISLHVRRGDYASNAKTTAWHGLCSLEYYQNAIACIAKQVSQPHFYVFSDDMDWVRQRLNINFPHHYIDHNRGADSYNDMRLMSLCQHHILANSSFSWWGAWLNANPKKIVIAPKKWFAQNIDTKDLMPQGTVIL